VAEVIVEQFGMAVEAEALDQETPEVADEKIGEVERAGLLVVQGVEGIEPGIEGVAVRTRQALVAMWKDVPQLKETLS